MSTKNGDNYPPDGPSAAKAAEWAEAAAIDARFEKVLQEAQSCGAPTPMTTKESIRAGKAAMKQGEANAAKSLLERIARHELVTEEEFAIRLGVSREWIADALANHRLFLFLGPKEVKYFPAFYCDTTIDRRSLEEVCEQMGDLASASKYYFFTSKSTFLLVRTPLEALRDGLLTKVLMAADGFASR
jgi:hypothetical protein